MHKGYEADQKEFHKNRQQFIQCQDIIDDLKEATRAYDTSGRAEKHIERMFNHNVVEGNVRMHGFLVVTNTFKLFASKAMQTEENIKLATYLGYCFEMIIGSCFIVDDIIDGSPTRRKKLCWHKMEDVQLSAINDAFMLEAATYVVLKKHFSHLDCYVKLLELFRETIFVGSIGQYLDIQTQHQDFTTFTMDQYKKITETKTVYPGGYIPMAIGLQLANVTDPDIFQEARSFSLQFGAFFQFQNDFTDCYADPKVIGKVGTDIEEGRCTWLACKFLELATPVQKKIFKENYGKADPLCVKRIKELYDEVSMVDICLKYEDEIYEKLNKNLEFSSKTTKPYMHLFLKTCHKYVEKH
ncbi:farnesyl pyrophosphate synthase-like [Phlebotomus papatasi]|uniref:farnesyl pyrophosphate synthase-like n=1 Tax=Phlebotomus papatasi TaxID=29031 RepID=UPI00248434DF|nr:farnesyl pyrophosphate synthase-like [Phlebotomus papatasi]